MIPAGTKAGPVWRCAGGGTEEVYLVRVNSDGNAVVSRRVTKRSWAKTALVVPMTDLFLLRSEARAEFSKRRAAQIERDRAWVEAQRRLA